MRSFIREAGKNQPPLPLWFLAGVGLVLFAADQLHAGASLGPVFRMTGVADGLPDSRVEAVVQDAHGYIWIATRSGLVRHEGNRLNVIGSDPAEPDPLPGRNIMALHAHSDGTVWAAVGGQGLVQIGSDLRQLRHVAPIGQGGILPHENIWSMTEDCDGRLWVAYMQGGVGRFDPETADYRHYPQDESAGLYPSGFQLSIAVDSLCRVWLAQSEQLSVLESPDGERFNKIARRESRPLIMHVGEARGEMYYTEGSRLYTLGPVATAATAEPVEIFAANRALTGFAAEPETGRLLVTGYDGMHRLHPQVGQPDHFRAIPGLPDGLPGSNLLGILFDAEGGAWITVSRHGVAYMPRGHGAFERHQPVPGLEYGLQSEVINALAASPNGRELWLGTFDQGIETLDLESGETAWLRQRYGREILAGPGPYTDLRIDGSRAFLVQHTSVSMLDLNSGELAVLLRRDQIDEGTFNFVRLDGPDRLWVGTLDTGLVRLDLATGNLERFSPDGKDLWHLPETDPVKLQRGPDGHWWLAAGRGIYRFDELEGFKRIISLSRSPLLSATWDDHDLWLATEVSLQHWRWQDGEIGPVETHDLPGRLPPGRVHQIFPVEDSGIWLVRSSGLARFDPDSGMFRSFGRNDGLATAEFFRRSAVRMADGRIAIGGSRGLVLVDPWQTQGARVPPPVYINAVSAGERHVRLAPGAHPAIDLDHNNNSFFIDYSALSYASFDQNRYRVKLEGWDDAWLEFVGQTRHHYSNLPPGKYRFRVQAATADGAWNASGDSLPVRIKSPPWSSGWALAAYVILGATGAGLGWRSLANTRRRRREMREAQQMRALAEEQRQVVERLNRSLEPLELARTIAQEMLAITGGQRACIGFMHDQLPRKLVSTDGYGETPTREQWRGRLDQADGERTLSVTLSVEDRPVGQVLIDAGPAGFEKEFAQRLELLVQMAAQALHNALLLERNRRLAERAEQASSAKSEFLATMSHEIRTPLHGVLGMVELLYETETEPGQQDIIHTIRQSGMQLQRIIDDVLDISRIEAGHLSLDAHPFELGAMLEQVIDLHAPNAARKNLDLRLRIASNLPLMACGDPDRISQVLGNLLSNAVKFTESGGVELVAEVDRNGDLELAVCDSGPGISPADRERLFEPFTQLDASITRSHSGSGLGLAICRRLVEAMGGKLALQSLRSGGSRFVVRLPVLERRAMDGTINHMTSMLDQLVLAAIVSAPAFRVLHRLARRWNLRLANARRQEPVACDLLLLDPHSIGARQGADVAGWIEKAEASAWLQSPYSRSGPDDDLIPVDAHFLRWPLVESRLIGLLLDMAIARTRP